MQFSQVWKYVCCATTSGAAVYVYNHVKSKEVGPLNEPAAVLTPHQYKWDYNWDRREVSSLVKPNEKPGEECNSKKIEEKPPTPTAVRRILMIRHGQYNLDAKQDVDAKLTPLGAEQAHLVGKRLKELDRKYTGIISSTMTRAMETADIIRGHVGDIPMVTTEILEEGFPIPTEPPTLWRADYKFHADGPRLEAAFRKYFHRADPTQTEDSIDIMVCHANVIRYFVCRVLQLPPEGWLRFSLRHSSITWVVIPPCGRAFVSMVGDSGFLPGHMLTTK